MDNIERYKSENINDFLTKELGPGYASYRRLWNNISTATISKFPIHIDFEVNDKCNSSCSMCPRNSKTHPDINYKIYTGSVLEVSDYKKIIDEGSSKGLMSVNLGAFGEPLLSDKVFSMVDYAHEKGIIDSRIITNGMLLHNFTDEIFESGLVNLFVSIDAYSNETYRQIRGRGFEQVKFNLLDFLEKKKQRKSLLPIVRVSFVKMPANKKEENAFIKFWEDKVDIIDIQVFDDFNVDTTKPMVKNNCKKWDCMAPWKRVAVLSNSNIIPCCNFFGWNIPIGNIIEDSIEKAWHSSKMMAIREGILDDSFRNCSICQRVGSA